MDGGAGDGDDRITATEAAARLGVKRETLYAYVSRGMLESRRALDGKTSTFDRTEVDALRARRGRRRDGAVETVIGSGITRIADDGLSFRGRAVEALVPRGFEAVAGWLWGDPDSTAWAVDREVEQAVARVAIALPEAAPGIDRLRLAAAVASAGDPLRHDRSTAGVARIGRRLLSAYLGGLPVLGRERSGGVADRLWPRLTARRGGPDRVAALDTALVVLADHDLASSTFAVRVAASVRADPYSVAVTGLGALGGPLHGAASAGVHELFARADQLGSPGEAVGELLRRDQVLPGLGHPVYQRADPRYRLLQRATTTAFAGDRRLEVVEAVTGVLASRSDRIPNIDLALGGLTWLAGMEPDAGEVIFAISRTVGWLAHAVEEYGEAPLRFRPRSLPR